MEESGRQFFVQPKNQLKSCLLVYSKPQAYNLVPKIKQEKKTLRKDFVAFPHFVRNLYNLMGGHDIESC